MTTALFLLRCVELGLSMEDLNVLTYGMVIDMFSERSNDDYDYPIRATQRRMPVTVQKTLVNLPGIPATAFPFWTGLWRPLSETV